MDDEVEPEFRSVGAEILCHPEVADEIAQRLRDAVGEILADYSEDEIADYGTDCVRRTWRSTAMSEMPN
ncbi:hypothetical protein [Kitasatospora sp. NBC_01302]|uniref:hypothetical protein n=1 Tax=Kitasatospora sp. NBC_01302 TaxID=2903575 RepID=UPI002E0D5507|nr:hypothetical protein OG294_40730 [Kitasatospora sp. NBC_01302]